MSQPRDPTNNFVELVQVWGGFLNEYLEGVVMYDSRNGRFTAQVGYIIEEGTLNGNEAFKIISTRREIKTIERQSGI